jgi:hypothetical protein
MERFHKDSSTGCPSVMFETSKHHCIQADKTYAYIELTIIVVTAFLRYDSVVK